MPAPSDWTGIRQGSLYVTRRMGSSKDNQTTWECKCDCGAVVLKTSGALRGGRQSCSAACGVSRSNRQRTKHGLAKGKEYRAWQAAKQRCLNPNNPNYKHYGARGISMHPDWVIDFAAFYAHIGPAPGEGRQVSVDRINNDGNYEPNNVRWATTTRRQLLNRRGSRMVDVDGVSVALADAAEAHGLPYTTVDARWRRGLRGAALLAPRARALNK